MKALILIVLVFGSTSVYAQYAVYASNHPNVLHPGTFDSEKVTPPGLKMKRIGTIMTIVGGVGILTGTILIATAPLVTFFDSGSGLNDADDNRGYYGVLLAANGVALIVPGIILWSKGSKKYKNYLRTQSNLSIGPTQNGVGLRLRF